MIYKTTLNNYGNVCKSCTIYIVLLVIFFIISTSISTFTYFQWYLKKYKTEANANTNSNLYILMGIIKEINAKYLTYYI